MNISTSYQGLKGYELGQIQNNLGILTKDKKGHFALDSSKFLEITRLNAADGAKSLEVSRPAIYKGSIALKPSTRLTERVFALVVATDTAYELFNKSTQETINWMMSPNSLLFGASPFEVCMRGDGQPLIQWLLDRAGQTPVAKQA